MAGKKLLVADDSLTIQKVIRLALTNEGYDIHAVSDGNHALQQIALFRPDVVLIDVSLPGKSAFEVKREINQTGDGDEFKFILMSSAFERIDEAQIEEVSFHARLTKPFDPAQLRQTLSDVINWTPSNLPPLPSGYETPTDSFADFEIREPSSDPLMAPIEPDELPPLPSVSIESVSQLWEMDGAADLELPPLPQSSDSDIRHLAEITLAPQSGQELEWNIHEALPSFDFSPEEEESPITPPPFQPGNIEMKNSDMPPPAGESTHEIKVGEKSQGMNTPQAANQFQFHGIAAEDLEKMIQQQVQAALEKITEKIAKNLISSIAEKIIKEEIHRLLTEPEAHPS